MGNTLTLETNTQSINTKPRPFDKRIHEIDFLRGVCMFLVFIDHLFYNLGYYFSLWNESLINKNGSPNIFLQNVGSFFKAYWDFSGRAVVQVAVLCLFLFVSGVSCAFSKNNFKRAAIMVLFWLVLMVGSNFFNSMYAKDDGTSAVINWNVIANVAFCVLIYCFFQNRSWRAIVAMILIFSFFYLAIIPMLFYYFGDKASFVLPLWSDYSKISKEFYNPNWSQETISNLGKITISGNTYLNADYMPLFPYIIAFFVGALVARLFYKEKRSLFRKYEFERPVCFVGRHSLIFYFGSQIVYMALFGLINLFF